MHKWTAGVCFAALVAASPAFAGEGHDSGYFKLEGGIVLGDDHDFEGSSNFTSGVDAGWTFAAGVGKSLWRHWRGEIEAAYQTQDYENDGAIIGGDVSAITVMPMLFRDFGSGHIRPFVGGGAGLSVINADPDYAGFADPALGSADDEVNFAWQATAGIAFDTSERLAMSVRYRYMDAGDYDLGPAEGEYANHAILGGLSIKFGGHTPTPPPPPPPPPEPDPEPDPDPYCKSEEKIVYFDFDRSEIRPDAEPVLNEAVQLITECETDLVVIEGHTDTSGSDDYNDGLSQRRADAVRSALIRRGVPEDLIETRAFGESRPAVRTGDGVREQANRRSVVVIRIE